MRVPEELFLFAACIWTIAILSLCESEWSRLHMGLDVDWSSMSFYFFIPATIWTTAYPLVRIIHKRYELHLREIRNWFIHTGTGIVFAFTIKVIALVIDFELKDFIKPMDISLVNFLYSVRYLLASSILDNFIIYWVLVGVMQFYRNKKSNYKEHPLDISSNTTPHPGLIMGLPSAEIQVIQAYGNYLKIHSVSSVTCVRGTVKSITTSLDSHNFIRVHRSYVVNKAHVKTFIPGRTSQIEMNDGQLITVSSGYRTKAEETFGVTRS